MILLLYLFSFDIIFYILKYYFANFQRRIGCDKSIILVDARAFLAVSDTLTNFRHIIFEKYNI